MRSCFFLGALAGAFLSHSTFSSAQGDLPGGERSARGAGRPAGVPAAETPAPPSALPISGGKTVPRDSKLSAGDIVTVNVLEDQDRPLQTRVTDTGEVEINGLGSVYVAGKTSMEAQSAIESYLKQRYYHRATVDVRIISKAVGTFRPSDKAVVAGKVGRPGPQYFNGANPLKLSEAVIIAGTGLYSDLSKVRLTRGAQTTEHNLNAIMKDGKRDLDVVLQDGDQVYVPAAWLRFRNE